MQKEISLLENKEFFSLSLTQPYRSQYGSVNPAAVVGPGIAATLASTLAAVVYCKMVDK